MPILQSISVIQFGENNSLFIGDSKAAAIFAFELNEGVSQTQPKGFNIFGIDNKIAALLGAPLDQITIKDFAIHPLTKEAYIGIHRGHGAAMIPVIVKINQDGKIQALELEKIKHTKLVLKNAIHPDVKLWNHVIARTLAITDIKYHQGELFVAGLSNADFSSTLYRIPYPFNNTVNTSSIEMFHAVHDQFETRAPIETMVILNLNNKPHVLAAYTCTPLVTVPVDALKSGQHVKGKTIGELGYGNAPIDMVHFQAKNMQGTLQDLVLITSKNRGAKLFTIESLEQSNSAEGITTGLGMGVAGPDYEEVPLAGLIHVANQDQQYLAGLRRDIETGQLNLVSFMKGAYFRLSDFVSEYMLPGYVYPAGQSHGQQFQEMMKKNEAVT